ncbi:MAG: DUF3750 domain-containing protein [Hyphomicrobiales bacterium]|nr:DUF3750 domain-containing protein [Hyphomicrobiales bacterium]
MFRFVKRLVLTILIIFLLPAALALVWWGVKEHPSSWRTANWQSAGVLPPASRENDAVIYVMAARTGGMKGALAVHSWIVTKQKGAANYIRYDKLGWGDPVRRNAYAADARWYSNSPNVIFEVRGKRASMLTPKIETAIASYPYSYAGGYNIWPGPNSNSFVAHVVNNVPELGIALPANAVGRNFLASGNWYQLDADWTNLIVSWDGLVGFALGARYGFEVHFMGLVSGFDVLNPAIKLPGFGRIGYRN